MKITLRSATTHNNPWVDPGTCGTTHGSTRTRVHPCWSLSRSRIISVNTWDYPLRDVRSISCIIGVACPFVGYAGEGQHVGSVSRKKRIQTGDALQVRKMKVVSEEHVKYLIKLCV